MRRRAVAYGLALTAFVVLLVHGTINPDLPQFDGKAMAARLVLFPIAAVIVLVGWWVCTVADTPSTTERFARERRMGWESCEPVRSARSRSRSREEVQSAATAGTGDA